VIGNSFISLVPRKNEHIGLRKKHIKRKYTTPTLNAVQHILPTSCTQI